MKLTHGMGSPETGGCWMLAASMYSTGEWNGHPECVPPTLRALCIRLSDMCDDGEREELIGPHRFAPMGRDASPEAELARAELCADWAVRRYALECPETREWAEAWLSGKDRSESAAWAAAKSAWAARAAAWAAAGAARAAAGAAEEAAAESEKRALLDLILQCCEIGNNPPQELDPDKVNEVMRVVCKEEGQ